MTKQVFPTDTKGRILFCTSLIFAGYLYLARVVITDYFVGTIGTFLRFFFWISPILWLIGLLIYIIVLGFYIIKLQGHLSPGYVLIIGLLLAYFIPVPS